METKPSNTTTSAGLLATGNPYALVVRDLQACALTQFEIASIVHKNTRSVQNWASGATKPSGEARERLLELKFLCERLQTFMGPEAMEIFWNSRNAWLDDERPIDVLQAGDFARVLKVISAMGNREF